VLALAVGTGPGTVEEPMVCSYGALTAVGILTP
jgi:hypothetical protein